MALRNTRGRKTTTKMHSSQLRGDDFSVRQGDEEISHPVFFHGTSETDRLGVVTRAPLDGLGATALILASVTAFYDAVRASTDANDTTWRTYPDFYSLQLEAPRAAYGMLDIWPDHKDVEIQAPHPCLGQAVIDRSPHTLLLPTAPLSVQAAEATSYDAVHLASLRRAVRRAFLYDPTGVVEDADLHVTCPSAPLDEWVAKVASTVDVAPSMRWSDPAQSPTVTQSFRRITLEEAILHLNALEHPA